MSFLDDSRWADTRDRPTAGRGGSADTDPREAGALDPRDAFTQGLDLPRGPHREPVSVDGERYDLRGSEVRTLAALGAFRVIPLDDLRDDPGQAADRWHGDIEHLREQGLIRHVAAVDRENGTDLFSLTERGRALLEAHRSHERDSGQRFSVGPARERELSHDAQLYRAYLKVAERLADEGARIERVTLEHDLKREYQRFLQEPNRGRSNSDGRPARSRDEIRQWAEERELAYVNGRVQFPDLQIEHEWPDGRREIENVEVLTPHYRGQHVSGKASAGFTMCRVKGMRVGGRTGRGHKFDPDLAEELLR
jgi:hypothetical protein